MKSLTQIETELQHFTKSMQADIDSLKAQQVAVEDSGFAMMDHGQHYLTIYGGKTMNATWTNHIIDYALSAQGLVFFTQEAAEKIGIPRSKYLQDNASLFARVYACYDKWRDKGWTYEVDEKYYTITTMGTVTAYYEGCCLFKFELTSEGKSRAQSFRDELGIDTIKAFYEAEANRV